MTPDASEPLLSADETNALLDAMRQGTSAGLDVADLTSREHTIRASVEHGDDCARSLARDADRLMIRMVRCTATAREQPSDVVPARVIRDSIEDGSAVASLVTDSGEDSLVIAGPELTGFVLDRSMGAPPAAHGVSEGPVRSTLSRLDRRILERVLAELVESFSRRWCGDPRALRLGRIFGDRSEIPGDAGFEPMLRLGLQITPAGAAQDDVVFALSASALRDSSPVPARAGMRPGNRSSRAHMVANLCQAEVEVVAHLGSATSTVGQVLRLEAGDIIRLDSSPEGFIDLSISGDLFLRGQPVLRHGNVAVDVNEVFQRVNDDG